MSSHSPVMVTDKTFVSGNNRGADALLSRHPACVGDINQVCDPKRYNLGNNVDVIECLSLEENVSY